MSYGGDGEDGVEVVDELVGEYYLCFWCCLWGNFDCVDLSFV